MKERHAGRPTLGAALVNGLLLSGVLASATLALGCTRSEAETTSPRPLAVPGNLSGEAPGNLSGELRSEETVNTASFEPIDLATELPPGVEDLGTRRAGSDWPTFLGARQDARSTESGIVWPEGGPPILWHRAVAEGYSMPTVAHGRLFLFDRHGDRARLSALESETGKELWRAEYPSVYVDAFQYSGGPRSSPLVDGDRVYALGVDGRLRCHRVVDGRVVWERDTVADFGVVQNFFGIASTPVISEGLLIVPVGGSPEGREYDIHAGEVAPNQSGIVAFDKLTGEVRYRAFDELASYSSPVLRSFRGEPTALWFGRSDLWLFDPRNGDLRARFPWKAKRVYSVNAANPVTSGPEIFLSEAYEKGGVLLRYRSKGSAESQASAGASARDAELEVVWEDPPRRGQSMANHWNTAIHHGGHLYGSSGEKSGSAELRAVVWSTGEVKWSERGLKRATMLYVDGHFVVLGEYGDLRLIEATPEAYTEVGRASPETSVHGETRSLLRFPAWSPPILAHGILYVKGADHLVALDLIPPS